ncbi:hypothetical protein ABLV92_02390 [Staphylococcus equorum]
MKKLLVTVTLSGVLLLGACGNSNSSEDKSSNLEPEKQEEIYKKESKKLGSAIVGESESDSESREAIKDLSKAIDRYESKTENLDGIDTEIGDYALKVAKITEIGGNRLYDLDEFKEKNPDKKETYDLALTDTVVNVGFAIDSISSEYEDYDISYKNEYLGKKANEEITDILAITFGYESNELIERYGAMVVDYDEDLNDDQLKSLSNTDYREKLNKLMITEEADVSKKEYNESVNMFNKFAPEFLHYEEADEMVSATENLNMMDIRNGVVGANTEAGVDSYGDVEDMEEKLGEFDDTEEDTSSEESIESSEEEESGYSAEAYNDLVDEYNSLTDGEKMDHVDEDVLDIEYEQLDDRVTNLQ